MFLNTEALDEVQQIIGIVFRKPQILQQALVHRSYVNEHPGFDHNERLEFLGDAVLECVVTAYLFKTYPRLSEGDLTNLRAALVNSVHLAQVAEELGLGRYLLLSKGEQQDMDRHSRSRPYLLANMLEAIIGAIYCDWSMGTAELFCLEFLLPRLETIRRLKLYLEPKSQLQELLQEQQHVTPKYRVLAESGPDHYRLFTVGVFFGERLVAQATGESKSRAQTRAATVALKQEFNVELPSSEAAQPSSFPATSPLSQ